ncbi:hypothetical protein [Actinomycetospora atypica]|uniref:Uncharacterized protein n=1 Tax=Actinomycetospora atypica TaxID=1290095 RepID=A0ABV9YGU2_9PSEU
MRLPSGPAGVRAPATMPSALLPPAQANPEPAVTGSPEVDGRSGSSCVRASGPATRCADRSLRARLLVTDADRKSAFGWQSALRLGDVRAGRDTASIAWGSSERSRARMSRMGRRPRTVAETSPAQFGVPAGWSAAPTEALEHALSPDEGPVLAVGSSPGTVAATLHRAMRLMLGDVPLRRVPDPHTVDLPAVLARARREAPVVVLVLDAPPSLLEQLDAAVRALVGDGVRLVLGTRPAFLDAVLPRAVREDLAARAIRLPDDVGGPRTTEPPTLGARTTALVAAVAIGDRLGIDPPLGYGPLSAAPGLRLPRNTDSMPGPLLELVGVDAPDRALRRAEREAERAGLVRRERRRGRAHLVATAALADADVATSEKTAKWLSKELDDRERGRAGRVAFAHGEIDLAGGLLQGLEPDLIGPEVAERLGRAAEERAAQQSSRDHGPTVHRVLLGTALPWYRAGIAGDDPSVARRCRRAAGLIEFRVEQWEAVAADLGEVDDEVDLEVQDALGRALLALGRRPEARRRLALVATGDDDLAQRALETLAVDTSDGDDEEWIVRAAHQATRKKAFQWWLVLVSRRARAGQFEAALAAADEAATKLRAKDSPERREALALARAEVLRGRGDDDEAVRVLREVLDGGRAAILVVVTLLELYAARGDRGAVLRVDPTRWARRGAGSRGDELRGLLERLWSTRAEAAAKEGLRGIAERCRLAAEAAAPRRSFRTQVLHTAESDRLLRARVEEAARKASERAAVTVAARQHAVHVARAIALG